MQKRLKEIVIYILENGSELEPEQRAQLETMRAELSSAGLPVEAIEDAIRQVLEIGVSRNTRGVVEGIETTTLLTEEASIYLRRLQGLGLIDEMQQEEILDRAHRLRPEGAGLKEIQFLAASLIFDESLGFLWGWDGDNLDSARSLH